MSLNSRVNNYEHYQLFYLGNLHGKISVNISLLLVEEGVEGRISKSIFGEQKKKYFEIHETKQSETVKALRNIYSIYRTTIAISGINLVKINFRWQDLIYTRLCKNKPKNCVVWIEKKALIYLVKLKIWISYES